MHVIAAMSGNIWLLSSCGAGNTCCDQTGLPWFYRTLPQEVGDDIEVRICANQGVGDEDTYLEVLEIYVQ